MELDDSQLLSQAKMMHMERCFEEKRLLEQVAIRAGDNKSR